MTKKSPFHSDDEKNGTELIKKQILEFESENAQWS
jgi:hypothetical protein